MVSKNSRLEHYAARPVILDDRIYQQPDYAWKPRGLWVSCAVAEDDGPDWPTWCESEGFELGRLAVRHEVVLAESACILMIGGDAELVAFDREYCAPSPYRGLRKKPDWRRLAGEYQGIIISPYLWNQRLGKIDWYYAWDCASGCIWDLTAIVSLEVATARLDRVAALPSVESGDR